MSMQQGRGGMGSHKHSVSGEPGLPPGLKQSLAREENKRREKISHRQRMYGSVPELMRDRRARLRETPSNSGHKPR
jgi:hypothetical protein